MTRYLFLLVWVLISSTAFSETLECDKERRNCITDYTEITIGDDVVILTKANRLVAYGRVVGIVGKRRKIRLKKSYGPIYLTYKIRVGDHRDFKPIHIRSLKAMHFGLGFGNSSVGGSSNAIDIHGRQELKLWGLPFKFGGSFHYVSGEMTKDAEVRGTETNPFTMYSISGLVGTGFLYPFSDAMALDLTGMIGLGYIIGEVDGDGDEFDNEDYDADVVNGLALSGSVGAMLLFGEKSPYYAVGYNQIILGASTSSSLTLGLRIEN